LVVEDEPAGTLGQEQGVAELDFLARLAPHQRVQVPLVGTEDLVFRGDLAPADDPLVKNLGHPLKIAQRT
jgi:hypothetical protein